MLVFNHCKALLLRKRDFDEVKSCVDNLAIMATFLIGFSVIAVTSFKTSDWEDFKNALDACDNLSPTQLSLFTYTKIIERYKAVTLTSISTGLMVVVSVSMFHVYSDPSMVKTPWTLNAFVIYLAILVGISVFMGTWIFTFYYDIFTTATSELCSSLPKTISSTSSIVTSTVLIFSALAPIFLFSSTVNNGTSFTSTSEDGKYDIDITAEKETRIITGAQSDGVSHVGRR
jgi:hypothetical protein